MVIFHSYVTVYQRVPDSPPGPGPDQVRSQLSGAVARFEARGSGARSALAWACRGRVEGRSVFKGG